MEVSYHLQLSKCGKARCQKCSQGIGHGPYWFRYTTTHGQTQRTYVGKHLPPGVAVLDQQAFSVLEQMQQRRGVSPSLDLPLVRVLTFGSLQIFRRILSAGSDSQDVLWEPVRGDATRYRGVYGLLACLLHAPQRCLVRDQAIDALWPDADLDTGSAHLDRAVYSLRQIFEPERRAGEHSLFLETKRNLISLTDQRLLWCDADAFDLLVGQADKAGERGDPWEAERLYEEALVLYRGPFLRGCLTSALSEGPLLHAAMLHREALQRKWVRIILDLVNLYKERFAYAAATDLLEQLLVCDPAHDAATHQLMDLLVKQGRNNEVRQLYHRYSSLITHQQLSPSPEREALITNTWRGKHTPQKNGKEPAASPSALSSSGEWRRRAVTSPVVGREQELEVLSQFFLQAEQAFLGRTSQSKRPLITDPDCQRAASLLILIGDAGIGKTRLAEEGVSLAEKHGWVSIYGRSYANESNAPYSLWKRILNQLLRHIKWRQDELARRPLLFSPLLSILPDLPVLSTVPSPVSSPQQEEMGLWTGVCELLNLLTRATPVVILLDDLHDADEKSCALLSYLIRRQLQVVFVATCLKEVLPTRKTLSLLIAGRHSEPVKPLRISRLRDAAICQLISTLADLPEALLQAICERARGNPYFAEQLAYVLRNQDASVLASELTIELPDTITTALELRLNTLSQRTRTLLTRATIFGGAFTLAQMAAFVSPSESAPDEEEMVAVVEEALKVGLLTEEESTPVIYHFWHPLLVDYLYQSLARGRCAILHRKAASVLIKEYEHRKEEGAAIITDHLLKGGADPEQIATWAQDAAIHAYQLAAYPDAEKYYRIALDARRAKGGSSEQDRLAMASLLECLGECARVQKKHEEAQDFYKQAVAIRKEWHYPN